MGVLMVDRWAKQMENRSVEKKVFSMDHKMVVKLGVWLDYSSVFQKAKQKDMNSVVLSEEKSGSTKE
jgi:hypothetical protein